MAYRRYRRQQKPTVHTITVKYAGKCVCCGGIIPVGAIADYFPVGTIAGVHTPQIAHLKAMDGNSVACSQELKKRNANPDGSLQELDSNRHNKNICNYSNPLNEDGPCSDTGYEDTCKEKCGL